MLKKIGIIICTIIVLFSSNTKLFAESYDYNSYYSDLTHYEENPNLMFGENDVYIASMNINIVSHDDFTFTVEETIKAHLSENHGIFVNIPYEPGVNNIENIKTTGPGNTKIATSKTKNANFKTIKLGDEDEYYNGYKTWKITYDIKGMKKSNNDKNYLSLSLAPAYWELPIKHIKTTVHLPKKVNWDTLKMVSGHPEYSPEKLEKDKHFKYKINSKKLVVEGNNLPEKYGASMGLELPKGYWEKSAVTSNYLLSVLVFFIGWLIIIYLFWSKFGKDKLAIETVEFYPPNKMSPMRMSKFINGEVDNKAIIATIINFANKGLITIEEAKTKKGNIKYFKIKKIKDISKKAPKYHKMIFNSMFAKGDTFKTNGKNYKFAEKVNLAKEYVKDPVKERFDPKAKKISILLMVTTLLLIFGSLQFIGYEVGNIFDIKVFFIIVILGAILYINSKCLEKKKNRVGFKVSAFTYFLYFISALGIISGYIFLVYRVTRLSALAFAISILIVVSISFTYFIKRRSQELVELQGKILGFRNFIELAEVDRINALVEENPKYFYDILPYAYIFGLTDKWIKNFESINMANPDWLLTDCLDLIGMMYIMEILEHDTMNSINTYQTEVVGKAMDNVSDIADNLSSGFSSSGGSSSDGGFGGGGGGAW